MPEFRVDKKKTEGEIPEITVPVSVGTLSTYAYLSGSIRYFSYMIENLESVASQNAPIREIINPTIKWMKDTRNQMVHDGGKLLLERRSDIAKYEKSIQDYERKINSPKIGEPELQDFLLDNPIIIDRRITKLIPKKSLGGENYPDFIAVLHNKRHVLIEIETPAKRLYTKDGHPTSDFSQADQQIQDYLRWANEDKDYLRKPMREIPLPDISVENTSGLLIIGMKRDLSLEEERKLERKRFECKNYRIETFDELLIENQQIVKSIREHPKNS